jgi:superfamily II DNA or RNA helicase
VKEPRPYQHDLETRLTKAWSEGLRHLLLQLSTGGGKSLCMAMLAKKAVAKGSHCLFTAHRQELIKQFFGVCAADVEIPEKELGIILPGYPENRHAHMQIGSIQTISRRGLDNLRPEPQLIFIDEAHRSHGSQYVALFKRFPNATFIGATATPIRLDGQPLKLLYDVMVQGPSARELSEQGYLANPRIFDAPGPDLTDLEMDPKTGDYAEKPMEKRFMTQELMGSVVENYEKHGGGQRAFVFATTVRHAQELLVRFRAKGHAAAVLTGKTPEHDTPSELGRSNLLAAFARGDVRVLISVGVLLEGVDCPAAKVCIWARATESITVYLQGTGRVLRPWSHVRPVIIDHALNVARLGMPFRDWNWSLDAAPDKRKPGSILMTKSCPGCEESLSFGARVCPSCGHVLSEAGGPPVEIDVELRERTTIEPLREVWERHWAVARKSGFKPGYVYLKYIEETRSEPPKGWQNEVALDCVHNNHWKHKLAMRHVMGQKRKQQQAAQRKVST